MGNYWSGGGGSKGGSYWGGSKKQTNEDDGLLGTGVGPSLTSLYKSGARQGSSLANAAGGVATGTASFLYHGASAVGHLASVGLANVEGRDPSAYWKAAHKDLSTAGQFPVGIVQSAGGTLGDVADIPRLVPGVSALEDKAGVKPGQAIRNTIGTGLADVGGIAAGKISANPLTPDNPANVAKLQQLGSDNGALAPQSFANRAKKQGYLLTALEDVGNVAMISKGATPALETTAEYAEGAGHSGVASIANSAAGASRRLEHPLKNTVGNLVTPITRAAFEARVNAGVTPGENVAIPEGAIQTDSVLGNYYDQYGKAHGMEVPNEIDIARTMPPEHGAALADAYQSKPTSISDLPPEEHRAAVHSYEALKAQTGSQYEFLTKPEEEGGMGVHVEYVNRADNPYAQADGQTNFKAMLADIQQNKHLYVDRTSPEEAHPYMSAEENDKFRAVHDAFGHSRAGNDFGPNGEEVAYQHHSAMYSPDAQGALAMETRGQNATLNFSQENLGRAEAGFPKQFDAQRVGLLPPEMSHPDYTKPPEASFTPTVEHPEAVPSHSAGESSAPNIRDLSPTADEFAKRAEKPIPPAAKKVIEKLGENNPITKGLARFEKTKINRTARIVKTELQRAGIEVPRAQGAHEPFMVAAKAAIDTLMGENKTLDPQEADRMIGQAISDRLTGVDAEERNAVAQGASQKAVDTIRGLGDKHTALPDEMRTPAVEAAINDAVSKYGDFAAKTEEGLKGSETHGDRGLEDIHTDVPETTKKIERLQKQIDRLSGRADAAHRRIPKEVERLTKERDALREKVGKQAEHIQAHTNVRNAAADRLAELRSHVAPPEEGSAGKSAQQMARATPALGNPDVQTLKDRIARAQDRLDQLPSEAATRRGTSVVSSEMNDEISQLSQTIAESREQLAKAAVQEKPNAALNRGVNLAYSVSDIEEASRRIAQEQHEQARTIAAANKLDERVRAGDTTSAKVEQQGRKAADAAQARLDKALETQPVSQWPRRLQPAGRVFMQMVEEAKTDPELARLIGDAEPTWRSFMAHANALGMDSKYVAGLTPEKVAQFSRNRVEMPMGKTVVAGARKEYTGALENADAADRSIEAFLAARTAMHQEIASNMLAGYFKDNFAIPVKHGDVYDPEKFTEFDPGNNFHMKARETKGGVRAVGDGYIISKTLAKAVAASEKDFNHWAMTANKYVLNPWRNAVITASPQFYVNHTLGHAVLATIEGVHLDSWVKAWKEYKARNGLGADENTYNKFSGHSIVGQGTAHEPTLVGPGGIADAVRRAEGAGSKAAAVGHAVASKLHNVTGVVDGVTRAAVYISDKGKSYSDAEAIQRAYSAVVDYSDLSPFEQSVARAVIPFYAFQKQLLKIVAKFPVDHPAVLALGAVMGRINQQQLSDEFGTSFPQGYAGLVSTGDGGTVNTHGINPFKDATSLASVDGITQALNPALAIFLRAGLNAPSGSYVTSRKVDSYGNLVPEVSPVGELKNQLSALPGVTEGEALAGSGKGPVRGTLRFGGVNTYDDAEMKKLVARIQGSQDAAAKNSPFAKKTSSSYWGK